jgi:uncharacterized protein involved in tellurium resistance
VIERLVKYLVGSQRDLDRAYQWGMDWVDTRK